jgi:hypothetical protein
MKTIDLKLYSNLRHQYDLRLAELEQAKAERNKAAMVERRKYLPKLRELKAVSRNLLAALRLLHDNLAEYQRINNIGGYENQDMQQARAAIQFAVKHKVTAL